MLLSRRHTRAGESPYADLDFELRTHRVGEKTLTVTVPARWSATASEILATKYLRRSGVPGAGRETDARQVFHRLAGCWTEWGKRLGILSAAEAEIFYDELCFSLAWQRAAPNSPQWFNTGLHYAYGITGAPQGHWYVDPASGSLVASSSAYERPQPHACFIQSIADDLVGEGGIFDLLVREARIFKYGSGSGTNFSSLRARGEPLSGGGESTGVLSFLKVADRAAAVVRSGGTARRAAKMVLLDVDHPEIEAFVDWKVREEEKVAALVAGSAVLRAGDDPSASAFVPEAYRKKLEAFRRHAIDEFPPVVFDLDWQGEAYGTASGQNANNSVRVTDRFLEAVEGNGTWTLVRRSDGKAARKLAARALWRRIVHAAWACADPGLQFADQIAAWHTCPAGGEIRASNPCAEYLFLDDTACNLASLNLLAYFDRSTGTFDVESFRYAVRLWTIVLEISNGMAQYPSAAIARNSFDYRTIGLGYANLGSLLMSMGLPYGSHDGAAVAGAITSLLTAEAYATSATLAERVGPFPRFAENREACLRVLRNHRRVHEGARVDELEGVPRVPDPEKFRSPRAEPIARAASRAWEEAIGRAERHGLRNAQVTAIAPTGTIALLMDCDTTGIEPDFALVKRKSLAGGGTLELVNRSVDSALERLGYAAHTRRKIQGHLERTGTIEDAPGLRPEHLPVFDCAVPAAPGSRALPAEAHLAVLETVQPFVSGGISKTLNLPHDAGPDTVEHIFLEAWKRGLKAIAIYRDGSKLSQPLEARSSDPREREALACPECG